MTHHHASADAASVVAFIRDFHAGLTGWFSGDGDRPASWEIIAQACPPPMVLIYPSGARLEGAGFLASIEARFGASPGFEAVIEAPEVLRCGPDDAVIAYVEVQRGARQSTAENRRAALAYLTRRDHGGPADRWAFRFIQETALPSR